MRDVEVYRDDGPVELSELDKVENELGFMFPPEYRDLLSKHNALYPERSLFDFFNSALGKEDSRDVTFFGFGVSVSSYRQLINRQSHDVYGHDNVVTFGSAANGDYVCFDYRHNPKTVQPRIAVMFHDIADENDRMLINFVSDSFEEFMDSLEADE